MPCPFRVTLSLSRAMWASWSKTLALLGPLEAATHAKHATTTSQTPISLDDIIRGHG
jgi:hypothetical protein